MDGYIVKRIEQACGMRKTGLDLATSEVLYEITTGELRGSWDSRISVRPMWEEYVKGKNGRPELHPSEPYVIVECSVAKAFNGQNVYGAPTCFKSACSDLIDLLEILLGVELPPASNWLVRRVDVAEVYRLPFLAIQEFFSGIQSIHFPRRRVSKHGDHSIHIPGTTTTIKFYHKGIEFAAHDRARLRQHFYRFRKVVDQTKRLDALQRLANNRLRVEVEVRAEKLDRDFGQVPKVCQIEDSYLNDLHDREVQRLMREGKSGMDTVRLAKDVSRRLISVYDGIQGSHLFAFWTRLVAEGEADVKRAMSKGTFYRNRKLLMDAGVSWQNTDANPLTTASLLPSDFVPLRTDSRHCHSLARVRGVSSLPSKGLRFLNHAI